MKLPGSIERKIMPPANHIRPKYDLEGLRDRREAAKNAKSNPPLPLTSMIDMLSMLVIFLIMNFSENGDVFFNPKDEVKLPQAESAQQLEGLPLLSVMPNKIILEMPDTVVGRKIYIEDTDLQKMLKIRRILKFVRAKVISDKGEKEFRGAVNIQADVKVPVEKVKAVMNALITEQWLEINFAVKKREGSSRRTAMRN